jgi:Ser/Thr protein kinase RdoA (MazF antagonist)
VRSVESLVATYRERSRGMDLQPIHGDCHPGNLLLGDSGWFFLDFDDMVIGPPVQDVWMLLPGRDAEADRQRHGLVEAYRAFRPFDDRGFDLIEPLRGFRFVFYAGWIAKRWDDPAFPDAFPHFGTDEYWENETRDLEELVDRIERGDDLLSPEEREERLADDEGSELTNKDFFWDL